MSAFFFPPKLTELSIEYDNKNYPDFNHIE